MFLALGKCNRYRIKYSLNKFAVYEQIRRLDFILQRNKYRCYKDYRNWGAYAQDGLRWKQNYSFWALFNSSVRYEKIVAEQLSLSSI